LRVVVAEAEPARHRERALAPDVTAARLQARLRARVACEQRIVASTRRHLPLEVGELGLDRELLRATREHVLVQRQRALAGRSAIPSIADRRALVVQRGANA